VPDPAYIALQRPADPAPSGAVDLVDQTGAIVNADAENVPRLLQSGRYRLASEGESLAAVDEATYGDSELRAGVEGAARGLTLGASDYVIGAIGGDEAKRDLAKRQQYNPVSAGIGEGVGIVGGALLTGGAAGALAPAAQLARAGRAAEGLAGGLRAVQALEAGGTLARAGAGAIRLGTQGALEGALYGAAKAVDDDYLHDHEITAERVALGAGLGALTGGAFGAGAGVLGTLGKAGIDSLPSLDRIMGDRAAKAVVGRTNKRAVEAMERLGGPEAFGQAMLDEGIVTARSTMDDIAAAASAKREEVGQTIRQLVGQIDDSGVRPDTLEIARRIQDEVIDPLKSSPITREIGNNVEAKLSPTMAELESPDGQWSNFQSLWEARKKWDELLAHERKNVSPALEEMRQARRVWEDSFSQLAEEAIGPEWRQAYQTAKQRYGRIAFASDQAQEAIQSRLANRFISPSDYGIGSAAAVGTAALSGSGIGSLVTGFLGSQVNRVARERGSAFIAGSLYAAKNARSLALAGEQAIEGASAGLMARVVRGASNATAAMQSTVPVLGVQLSTRDAKSYDEAAKRIAELQDPNSAARQAMNANMLPIREQSPEMADALTAHVQRTADFLATKVDPPRVSAEMFGQARQTQRGRDKARELQRYARAAQDPQGAVKRIGDGTATREDTESLKALYPRLWARLAARIATDATRAGKMPSYAARRAMSRTLGVPVDRAQSPEYVAWLQSLVGASDEAQAAERETAMPPSKAPEVDQTYATRTDQLIYGR
jgi:hypothetical protein